MRGICARPWVRETDGVQGLMSLSLDFKRSCEARDLTRQFIERVIRPLNAITRTGIRNADLCVVLERNHSWFTVEAIRTIFDTFSQRNCM